MGLITEALLREEFPHTDRIAITHYQVPSGTMVTPSARAWLTDHKIALVIGGKMICPVPSTASAALRARPPGGCSTDGGGDNLAGVSPPSKAGWDPAEAARESPREAARESVLKSALPTFVPPEYFDVIDGTRIDHKPEHLTALRGNLLVAKNHPQIRFRGKLDSLEADILVAQVEFTRLGLARGAAELGEVLDYVKHVLRCEVLDVPFEEVSLFGLEEEQIRHRSHYPRQYFGIPHFAASAEDGEAVVLLNRLRTRVRETELAAYDAFAVAGIQEPTRVDLIKALNRLSSAVYLMMFQAKTKELE